MLDQIAGITHVRMLYLQLLYRCNFTCRHCFHGELLKNPENFDLGQACAIMDHFQQNYRLDAVTFLGGEPLLYPFISAVCSYAKQRGLGVEICTNGHRGFRKKVEAIAPSLDKLRVSLDGLEANHDAIRHPGSFAGAIEMLDHAAGLGVTTGVTMTVTEQNLDEVVPLARFVQEHGATELKLHALRLVGNAAGNPGLAVADVSRYGDLHRQIKDSGLTLEIIYDADLSPDPAAQRRSDWIADSRRGRVECDPRGGLTISGKAVGRDMNAFRWDKVQREIKYEPRDNDEFATRIPHVIYQIVRAS